MVAALSTPEQIHTALGLLPGDFKPDGNAKKLIRCPNPAHDDKNPSFSLHIDGYGNCYSRCGGVKRKQLREWLGISYSYDPNRREALSPEDRKRIEEREAKQAEQGAVLQRQVDEWEGSLIAREIAEHGLPDTWRSLMLKVWTSTDVAIIEGIVRIWQEHKSLPPSENSLDLRTALGGVGIFIAERNVTRFLAESFLSPKLIPNDKADIRYMRWVDMLVSRLRFDLWRKDYSKDLHSKGTLLFEPIFELLFGINFGETGLEHDYEAFDDGHDVFPPLGIDSVGEGKSSRHNSAMA